MPPLPTQIANLLQETARTHHQTFIETDGFDPEWPLWYAQYLQEKLGRLLNYEFTLSQLVYELVRLNKAYTSKAHKSIWSEYYAQELASEFSKGATTS